MKKTTKLFCLFSVLISLSFANVMAATMYVKHDSNWYYLTGGATYAEDMKSTHQIAFYTVGYASQAHYSMSVTVRYNGVDFRVSSSVKGQRKTASFAKPIDYGSNVHSHKFSAAKIL